MNTISIPRDQLFNTTWAKLPPALRRRLKELGRYPTERNSCFTIGYLSAMSEGDTLDHETYSYLMALVGQYQTEFVLDAIRNAKEK